MSDIVIFSYAFHADSTIDGMFQSCSQTVLYNIFSWFFIFVDIWTESLSWDNLKWWYLSILLV